ncbi:MAG: SlyX family protein [Alphaproteobacteria bacterium]|nr:SlyX family protein [Alphaproteobacteria bacterium]
MEEQEIRSRLIEIEMALDNQQRAIDDLSEMLIKQGKVIEHLQKQNEWLKNNIGQDVVKPMEEETPPPHY